MHAQPATTSRAGRHSSPGASGIALFAGIVLAVSASFQILEGISAISGDEILAAGEDYVFAIDLTAWGWFHLVFGLVALVTAIGVIARRSWGWLLGILVACLSMIANFAYLPIVPLWALTLIVLDAVVIWAFGTLARDAG